MRLVVIETDIDNAWGPIAAARFWSGIVILVGVSGEDDLHAGVLEVGSERAGDPCGEDLIRESVVGRGTRER